MHTVYKYDKAIFTSLSGAWLVGSLGLALALNWQQPTARAILGMGCGLVVLWVGACGGIMLAFRQPLTTWVQELPLPWQIKFISFATCLALIEEAIATSMTNLAPLFGVAPGEAYITASANYIDVVLRHSVIIFVPMFIGWAWLLGRYAYTPFQVFCLFGMSGILGEWAAFGAQNLTAMAMWLFIYGLMVYLPAASLPRRPEAQPTGWFGLALGSLAPVLLGAAAALALNLAFPGHPAIHFPPLQG